MSNKTKNAAAMKADSKPTRFRTSWIKDFKNSVMCPYCWQQFNWENYEKSQDEFISKNSKCPLCGKINTWTESEEDENVRLIDADKAIAEFKRIFCCDCDSGDMCRACGYQYAIDIIDAAPTISAQPVKRGHWIELPKALNPNENPCKCSNCGQVVSFMNGYPKSKFCGECGADMRDETNA